MLLRPRQRLVLLVGVCALEAQATGTPLVRVATTVGLMQQPTSHYYHAVYGGKIDIGTANEGLIFRGNYVERPEFRSAGYADKDYGWFASVGTKVTKSADQGLYAFIGAGKMDGYVKVIDPEVTYEGSAKERTYSLPGPTAVLEYSARWHGIDVGISHQTFIGYVDDTQLEAYVAWPYNFFQVNLGYAW